MDVTSSRSSRLLVEDEGAFAEESHGGGLVGGLVGADPGGITSAVPAGMDVDRVIGKRAGIHSGPTLVVVAGIHGNEPAGVKAARRVLSALDEAQLDLRGELVVLSGNVRALRAGKRFLDRDLNRGWTEDQMGALRVREPAQLDAEDREQRELLAGIDEARARARGQVFIADLHTSSAPGLPFVLFGDTLAQRQFVRTFPIPVIIGLVEQVDGVLTEFYTRRGCVTFCIEGGQHESESSVEALESVIWLSLARAGMIDAQLDEVARAERLLDQQRRGLPRVLEVMSRRSITAEDEFVMEPGFKNIERVSRGQLLAHDVRGEIRAEDDGVVVLPLYQKLGSDGYFWAREVGAVRLFLSDVLRRLRFDLLAGALPGVRRDPRGDRVVLDDPPPAAREMLRLLGFRRERNSDGLTTWERAGAASSDPAPR